MKFIVARSTFNTKRLFRVGKDRPQSLEPGSVCEYGAPDRLTAFQKAFLRPFLSLGALFPYTPEAHTRVKAEAEAAREFDRRQSAECNRLMRA